MEIVNKLSDIKNLKKILFVITGSLILAISSKIQTPFSPVPATMQTFAVVLLGMILGTKLATITVVLYLFEGLIGLPVFAKGGGAIYFMGPTSGYLFGFIFGAFIAGYIKSSNGFSKNFSYLILSIASMYLFGLIWLWLFIGLDKSFMEIFALGAKPFLLIEFYKILILIFASKFLLNLRNFII